MGPDHTTWKDTLLPTEHAPGDLVTEIYEAVEAGDHEALRERLAPDLRWRQAGSAVPAAGEEVVGADALIERVVQPLEQDWEGFSEQLDEVIALDGRVVVTGTYHGRYPPTGRKLQTEFCHLWEIRDGVAVSFRQFTDTAAFATAIDPG